MSLHTVFARHVLAPAYDLARGTHTMRHLRELEESQWWPLERIQELQSQRLQRLVEHAYSRVPYYRRVMDEHGLIPSDIRTVADLPKLPILAKADIRAAGDSLISSDFDRRQLRGMRTSGSTGEPLAFYGTRNDQTTFGLARFLRALDWGGVRPGHRHGLLRRAPEHLHGDAKLARRLADKGRRLVGLQYGTFSDEVLTILVDRLNRERLHSIEGSPPVVAAVAAFVRRNNLPAPRLNAIICGGEQLYPCERRLLKEVFGPEPHSKYSSFEVFEIASECPAHRGLHIHAEDLVVEVVDEEGAALQPGHTGRVVLTNLHSYGVPFLRYEIGDYGAIDTGPCACGRGLPRLVGMLGRTSELIVTNTGNRVFAADIDLEALSSLGVRQYRIVQDEVGKVDVFIVWHTDVGPAARTAGEGHISAALSKSIGDGMLVVVHAVDEIPTSRSGKHQVVVSRVTPRITPNERAVASLTEEVERGAQP